MNVPIAAILKSVASFHSLFFDSFSLFIHLSAHIKRFKCILNVFSRSNGISVRFAASFFVRLCVHTSCCCCFRFGSGRAPKRNVLLYYRFLLVACFLCFVSSVKCTAVVPMLQPYIMPKKSMSDKKKLMLYFSSSVCTLHFINSLQ